MKEEAAAFFDEVCVALVATATRLRLYGAEHRLTRQSLERLLGALERGFLEEPRLRVEVTGNELVVNDRSVPVRMGPTFSLARRLGAKGIGLLEILPGVSQEEILGFCDEMADPGRRAMSSRPHLKLGEAAVVTDNVRRELESLRVQDLSGSRAEPVSAEIAELKELVWHFREHREIRFRDCDEIVYSFLARLSRGSNVLSQLAEIREHHLFTFLHIGNVTTLTMSLAQHLGLREQEVRDFGFAALLHDVGKLIIPESILSGTGPLSEGDWAIVRRHPVEGARMLLKQPRVPRTAVVVAFEHHLHHTPPGGYPVLETPRVPCLQAQLVAVADCFDALFSRRSYHRSYDILESLEILQDSRGTIYNPWLVDDFTRFMLASLEQREPDGGE